jgi:hypothetical protein
MGARDVAADSDFDWYIGVSLYHEPSFADEVIGGWPLLHWGMTKQHVQQAYPNFEDYDTFELTLSGAAERASAYGLQSRGLRFPRKARVLGQSIVPSAPRGDRSARRPFLRGRKSAEKEIRTSQQDTQRVLDYLPNKSFGR